MRFAPAALCASEARAQDLRRHRRGRRLAVRRGDDRGADGSRSASRSTAPGSSFESSFPARSSRRPDRSAATGDGGARGEISAASGRRTASRVTRTGDLSGYRPDGGYSAPPGGIASELCDRHLSFGCCGRRRRTPPRSLIHLVPTPPRSACRPRRSRSTYSSERPRSAPRDRSSLGSLTSAPAGSRSSSSQPAPRWLSSSSS